MEAQGKDQDLAQSLINICSVYSEMGKHEIALKYCSEAVSILDSVYKNTQNKGNIPPYMIQVIAAANNNAAIEYEYLGEWSESLVHYSKAV